MPGPRALTEPFRLPNHLVINAEWMEFIDWLHQAAVVAGRRLGKVLAEGCSHPLYWEMREGPALDDDAARLPASRPDRASRTC